MTRGYHSRLQQFRGIAARILLACAVLLPEAATPRDLAPPSEAEQNRVLELLKRSVDSGSSRRSAGAEYRCEPLKAEPLERSVMVDFLPHARSVAGDETSTLHAQAAVDPILGNLESATFKWAAWGSFLGERVMIFNYHIALPDLGSDGAVFVVSRNGQLARIMFNYQAPLSASLYCSASPQSDASRLR